MIEKLTITEEPGDPKFAREMAQYRRNREWLVAHDPSFFDQFRGRYIAAAGGEVFVADDAWEAERLAKEKHPQDVPFIRHIPREKLIWIYAC